MWENIIEDVDGTLFGIISSQNVVRVEQPGLPIWMIP